MDGGLPYDAPSPSAADPPVAPAQDADGDHPMLDRALEDYTPARAELPEHVQGLIGRMGRGKVYLVEESVGIVHHDGEQRIRGNPRLAALARDLESQDPTSWLSAISDSSDGSPIRANALFVSSELIKHLSTDKVISWATGLGAGVLGLEWLNDTSLVLVFPAPAAALLGLSLIAKAGFDPAEGDDPLLERAAHSVPVSLLPLAEPERLHAGDELLPTDAEPAVRRKGRGAFGSSLAADDVGRFDLAPLADVRDLGIAPGIDPNERVTVRYATEADGDRRRQANESDWYRRHGRRAGKEVGPARGPPEGSVRLGDRVGTNGEGRDLSRRLGRERRRDEPYARPDRDRRPARDDLDAELDRMRAGGGNEDRREARGGGGGRRGQREHRGKDDLDKELDDLFAARAAG